MNMSSSKKKGSNAADSDGVPAAQQAGNGAGGPLFSGVSGATNTAGGSGMFQYYLKVWGCVNGPVGVGTREYVCMYLCVWLDGWVA
jgi:hypothetical protein